MGEGHLSRARQAYVSSRWRWDPSISVPTQEEEVYACHPLV